jgi:hypothetical protein
VDNENTDRAQLASLGRTIEERAATIVATLGETDTPFFPSEVRDHEAYVAAEIRGAVDAAGRARECFVTESGSGVDLDRLAARNEERKREYSRLSYGNAPSGWQMRPDYTAPDMAATADIDALLGYIHELEQPRQIDLTISMINRDRADLRDQLADAKREAAHWFTLYEQCVERLKQTVIDERRAHALADLVRRWTHGEEALIQDMSILAGDILGGPLESMGSRPAAGLDVERLVTIVEFLVRPSNVGAIEDDAAREAFFVERRKGGDDVRRRSFRALVLAALGIEESGVRND